LAGWAWLTLAWNGDEFWYWEQPERIPPTSPMKATFTGFANYPNDVCLTSFSINDDVIVLLSSQDKEVQLNYSTHPPEGKTTTIVAVMRGQPKNSYHQHPSNKHYKKKLVQILLDSESDTDLVFVCKDKSMLFPYPKRLVPQVWNTLNGIFQTKCKARVELNFFDYSDSKRYYSNLMWSSTR
jgi:hypothetical protein